MNQRLAYLQRSTGLHHADYFLLRRFIIVPGSRQENDCTSKSASHCHIRQIRKWGDTDKPLTLFSGTPLAMRLMWLSEQSGRSVTRDGGRGRTRSQTPRSERAEVQGYKKRIEWVSEGKNSDVRLSYKLA